MSIRFWLMLLGAGFVTLHLMGTALDRYEKRHGRPLSLLQGASFPLMLVSLLSQACCIIAIVGLAFFRR